MTELSERATAIRDVYGACMNEEAGKQEERELVKQEIAKITAVQTLSDFRTLLASRIDRPERSFVSYETIPNQDDPRWEDVLFDLDVRSFPERSYYENPEAIRDLEVLAGEVLVDVVRRLGELAVRVLAVGMQDPVLHIALGRDDDQQHALVGEPQELDLLEARAAARRHHHPGELRQVRQQVRGLRQHALRLVGVEPAVQPLGVLDLERLDSDQPVDEEAVASGRGDAAGRGVRAGDQSEVLEVGHHVADGGRRQVEPGVARERAGADRLAVGDVPFDQCLEESPSAGVQHGWDL